MFSRAELKSNAKKVLKQCYWKGFAVILICLIPCLLCAIPYLSEDFVLNHYVLCYFLGIIVSVFLFYQLEVGAFKFFIKSNDNDFETSNVFYAFKNSSSYFKVLITQLYRYILMFLWSLLLVIPGIIKFYSYSMVPFILADNPNIGTKRAIELSKKMTAGYKGKIFVLDLSFIGWFLLGAVVVVGNLFVLPYYYETKAQLYLKLRGNALTNKYCTYEELNLTPAVNDISLEK